MMKQRRWGYLRGWAPLLAAILIVCSAAPGQADTIEIRLINTAGGGDTGWITASGDVITFNGTVGNYSVNVSTALASNTTNPILDLASINSTTSASAGTLIIEAMASGYTLGGPTFEFQAGGTSSIGSASFAAYGGNNDTICAAGVNACTPVSNGSALIGTLGPFSSSPFAGSTFAPGNSVNPYSLGIVASFSGTTAGTGSFDANVSVPEPGSLLLLGSALAGLGLWQVKRQKNAQA